MITEVPYIIIYMCIVPDLIVVRCFNNQFRQLVANTHDFIHRLTHSVSIQLEIYQSQPHKGR